MSVNEAVPTSRSARRAARAAGRSGRRWHAVAALGAAGYLVVIVLASLFAPLPHNPFEPNADALLIGPSREYLFGTDSSGLDVFSRSLLAAKTDVTLAVVGSVAAVLVGVPLGLFASFPSRAADVLMRFIDTLQSLPLLVVAVVIVSLSGASGASIVIALVITAGPVFIRLVRAEGSVVRSRRYVEAAVACGATKKRVALRHILPNVTSVIFPNLALTAGSAILLIAALGFLGIGVQPPAASWGELVNQGAGTIVNGQWWVALFPGLFILVTVLAFNFVADGLYLLTSGARRR